MKYKDLNLPKAMKITGRTSSITNAFVNGIIPKIKPTADEIEEALNILQMSKDDVKCAYCGNDANQWDHFEPIVDKQRPRGYITEIYNLIPCCSTCNSSKSGSNWFTWITGTSKKSPKGRGISDIDSKINIIKQYEDWCDTMRKVIDIKKIVGSKDWDIHWKNHDQIIELMKKMQKHSDKLKNKISNSMDKDLV